MVSELTDNEGVANGLGRHQSTLTKEQLSNVLIV
jgi:hypothetical protein